MSETIFDLLLCGYIASIEAFRDTYASPSAKSGAPRESFEEWDDALKSAKLALSYFRDAESQRQNLDVAGAHQTVLEAQTVLNRR